MRKARQASREKRGQRQLRHEHAADEQRIRHLDVAERGVMHLSRQVIASAGLV